MEEIILSVRGLHKRIRRKVIVKDVTFSIKAGEIFGFLGPNGAGKTTTIRMLVGLIRPTSGEITINGWNLRKHPLRAMQNVGCIVENPDLYPYLTGYENLHQLALMQGPEAVGRIDEATKLVHLTHRIHEKVGTYSLGMKQRLGIAQALLPNPKLLILDEPTNGLDPAGIRELRTFLRELANGGMAIFISSHLLAEIELLCDSVAMIRDGQVVQTGKVADLTTLSTAQVVWRVSNPEMALPVLRTFISNKSGEVVHGPGDGQLSCAMTEEDVAGAVQKLQTAGCKIYEIVRKRSTLEDVFLSTTGGDTL